MSRKGLVVGAVALCMVAAAAGWWLFYKPVTQTDKATDSQLASSQGRPDESKANADNYLWKGAADEPKKIRIPKIGVNAYIQQVGVDAQQAVGVPSNIHLAGWFKNGSKPGQGGLAIIDGHVSGRTTPAVFKNLIQLTVDDEFEVQLGNGKTKRYSVIQNRQVKADEAANYLFSQNPKVASQLNLITCGGEYDDAKQTFTHRVIVSAKLL